MKYKGDDDAFARFSTHEEGTVIDSEHWSLMASLIQDVHLIKNGLASSSFEEIVNAKLKVCCDGPKTIEFLKAL